MESNKWQTNKKVTKVLGISRPYSRVSSFLDSQFDYDTWIEKMAKIRMFQVLVDHAFGITPVGYVAVELRDHLFGKPTVSDICEVQG